MVSEQLPGKCATFSVSSDVGDGDAGGANASPKILIY